MNSPLGWISPPRYFMSGINANETIAVYPEKNLSIIQKVKDSFTDQTREIEQLRSKVSLQIDEMEELLRKFLYCQLEAMGFFKEKEFILADVKKSIGILDLFDRWLTESINVLSSDKYLSFDGTICTVKEIAPLTIEEVWKEWELKKVEWLKDPNKKSQIVLVEGTVRNLPAILTGKIPAHDIMFPNSSMELVQGVYKHNPIAAYFNGVITDALVYYIQQRIAENPSTTIKILEIGAGTGGTSAVVFSKVKNFHDTIKEYCYTDLSKAFLLYAEKNYGPDNPFLTYKILNAEKPISSQGISVDEYDIVIATNVLHATKNIRQTIRNAKAALRKNGILLLNEMSTNNLYSNLTFGLLEGWWLYEDGELRIPGCPGLSPESWQIVLETEGFQSIYYPALKAHDMGQQIIIAESDGIVRQMEVPKESIPPVKKIIKTKNRQIKTIVKSSPSITPQKKSNIKKATKSQGSADVTDQMVENFVKGVIRESISEVLKVDEDQILDDWSFSEYGVDSILAVNLVNIIGKECNITLETTVLFDFNNVDKLSDYIITEYKPGLISLLQENTGTLDQSDISSGSDESSSSIKEQSRIQSGRNRRFRQNRFQRKDVITSFSSGTDQEQKTGTFSSVVQCPIAIIGMSGRFPKSESVDELWTHLVNGDDLVEKATRWDLSEDYSDLSEKDSESAHQGSFLDDIDKFDPLFFNISGLEAMYMDPQQRFFLEEAWRALEDAGYAGKRVQDRACGVYVGCATGDYELLLKASAPAQAFWGNAGAIISSRISYYLNLRGPAVSIDTACSSSLVAIHLACQGLWTREIEMAIAGGVYINSTPRSFLAMGKMGMISPTGRCFTFSEQADGFVLGEGVGALIFKRLDEAISDHDHIYGVIRGSGLNQDGASNGITAPSAQAQEMVERHVYSTFHINPEHIQMVEAHGTGTILGDPIEYNALTKAFRHFTDKEEFCAIGSIKSNMGHAAKAAGVIGMIKILLSLKNKKIPASLHFKKGNPNIQFKGSPFFVNTSLKEWDVEPGVKRTAATSAFGFSGTNAHVVVEEAPPVEREYSEKPGYLIVLSACTSEQLRQKVEQLVAFCEAEEGVYIGDMSYTLLLGRKHFDHRLACVVRSQNELMKLFTKWLEKGQLSQIYVSKLNKRDQREQPSMKKYGNQCIRDCQVTENTKEYLEYLAMIADLYIQGYSLEYENLFSGNQYFNISLPTYPFSKERYWIDDSEIPTVIKTETVVSDIIHPLVHQNTSNFAEQRFTSVFTGNEFFLRDHVVNGISFMPGVVYLEMARAATIIASRSLIEEGIGITLKNLAWFRPITVKNENKNVHISLNPSDHGEIRFVVYCDPESPDTDVVIHNQGTALFGSMKESPSLDFAALQSEFNSESMNISSYYENFKSQGMNYGPAHRGIEALYFGKDRVLVKLSLPETVSNTIDKFVLHPSMLDSALQGIAGLLMLSHGATSVNDVSAIRPAMPFALQELEIFDSCKRKMWALVRFSDVGTKGDKIEKYDVDLFDESGKICIRFKGFASILLQEESDLKISSENFDTLMLEPFQEEKSIPAGVSAPHYDEHVVILCETGNISPRIIEEQIEGSHCVALEYEDKAIDKRYEDYAVRIFERIRKIIRDKYPGNVLVQVIVPVKEKQQFFLGFSGFLKSAHLENPKLLCQMIGIDDIKDSQQIVEIIKENVLTPEVNDIRYKNNKRYINTWKEMAKPPKENSIPWKSGGVYLITGGAGGLGLIFAADIVNKVKDVTLILTGRSPLTGDKQSKIKALEESGSHIEYRQVDVTERASVTGLMKSIKDDFGKLSGIIHSAGVILDNFILKKTTEEIHNVLAPKVTGLMYLDEESKDLDLDFFVIFSSLAGVMGNSTQSDYAEGNAFMDNYAWYRNTLVSAKKRHGHTLSINWPLWKEGGMHVYEETEKMMIQVMGMIPMNTSTGIKALYDGVALGQTQMIVFEGDKKRLLPTFLQRLSNRDGLKPKVVKKEKKAISEDSQDITEKQVIDYLKKNLSGVIGIPETRIETDELFEKYGIDSLMVIKLTNQLEQTFGSLSKTLFFEYQSIRELSEYFMQSHPDKLSKITGSSEEEEIISEEEIAEEFITPKALSHQVIEPVKPIQTLFRSMKDFRFAAISDVKHEYKDSGALDIAIIGLSGRFPRSRDINQYWKNLRDGIDCITEIPGDRWDHSLYYDEDKHKIGKTYTKWGGFVDGAFEFDPLFFNISPLEAGAMDPQERLFLQCAYETIEDAGYTKEKLARNEGFGINGNVGVYAGLMYEEYQLYGAEETLMGRPIALSGNPSGVANRVSYFLNLHGPSMTVDSMCSSSLTTVHLACQSITQGECRMAIAGGVNLSVHPNKYLTLGQGKFASSNGRCESFGIGGDGYVPGEGVGAVLLKPLSRAIADGDRIYGVIKGTAINHGGKTNGYTVPNPNAQASVIGLAFKKAGINPRTVSYIEAHGTGTSLGDPIEMVGLNKAFSEYTKDKRFCALGSAKSNIGHCESAAGIAGIAKVILQLKYKQLVPSLHSKVLNPNIDFENTPFVVQQELSEWKRPVVNLDGESREYPRIAGISSFGAGGSNAHVIIQEYIPDEPAHSVIKFTTKRPAVIILSAKNEERLKEQGRRLLADLEENKFTDHDLADIAYTLQTGREAMEERMAVVITSVNELKKRLKDFIEGKENIKKLFHGTVKENRDTLTIFKDDDDIGLIIEAWIAKGKHDKVAELWVKGMVIDWNIFYGDVKPSCISLPSYPFAQEYYWVPDIYGKTQNKKNPVISDSIHPLLHQNTSDLTEQRFTSTFTGNEFFFKDHVVGGRKVMPGVVYLEMARAAVEYGSGVLFEDGTGIILKDNMWIRPIILNDQNKQVHISLFVKKDDEIACEVYTEGVNPGDDPVVHYQGSAVLPRETEVPVLDLKTLQSECSRDSIDIGSFYDIFKTLGINYGPAHRGIEALYPGKDQVLAKLSLPAHILDTKDTYTLHPSLMDAALQAAGVLMISGDPQSAIDVTKIKPALPFAIEELELYGELTSGMWTLIRYNDAHKKDETIRKLDITMCDEAGNVSVRIKGFSSRVMEKDAGFTGTKGAIETIMLKPVFEEKSISAEAGSNETAIKPDKHLIILCETGNVTPDYIQSNINGAVCISMECGEKNIDKRYETYAIEIIKEIRKIPGDKHKDNVLFQVIVPEKDEKQMLFGLSGILKTARMENPKFYGQMIGIEENENPERICEIIRENIAVPMNQEITYNQGKRYINTWNEIEGLPETSSIPWKSRGVYLITGGAGGLGLIFAEEIIQKESKVTLILTGRSGLTPSKKAKIDGLKKSGARIEYKQVDITHRESVSGMIQDIKKEFGNLKGIIHSAGVIMDSFIVKKTEQEIRQVLAPKVTGLLILDEETKDLSLDFFILFSSGSAAMGNAGQSDYAAANAFMDRYAFYRNNLVSLQQRKGQTLSINWPLWKEGNMKIDKEAEKMMFGSLGLIPMNTSTGIKVLYDGLVSNNSQILVYEGDKQRLASSFSEIMSKTEKKITPPLKKDKKAAPVMGEDLFIDQAIHYFKKVLSGIIGLPVSRIETDEAFEKYGIDSIIVMKLINQLEQSFGSLPKTLFFEYQSVRELTGYFLESHGDTLREVMGIREDKKSPGENIKDLKPTKESKKTFFKKNRHPRFSYQPAGIKEKREAGEADIAIIGLSGRFPQSRNMHEFWENLRNGRDCITEIPRDRWDHTLYFDEDRNAIGKTYSKWGGFLEGAKQFDPLFFNISPMEAEFMDPQERLFLQCVFETLEDAGYTRDELSSYQGFGLKGNIGVFAGAMYEEYQLFGAQESLKGTAFALSGNPSSIANRVSFYFDFHGPSMTLDSMCSSSLTTIHLAAESLKRGECEMAIAGGVNLSIHPNKYILLGQSKFVSSKGRCESFGEGGDGYVPGEGVGAVLLKPLSGAIADGDRIYGVIKGTAINHGGKTNAYTVPNPNAQASVIRRAFEEAGINPRTVSYIEAHGTGTSLGDPIEIAGLNKVFYEYSKDKQFCSIGSVKSNIGHCESAAGIAGIAKVLLQLKHRQLVPSLHSTTLNPNIDFENSPFIVQQKLEEWKRPVIELDGERKEYPRIAGISAFGAGGSNAHIIIEEYISSEDEQSEITVTQTNPAIIVLSARDEERLKERAKDLLAMVQSEGYKNKDLADIAYTLQTGREGMEERLGFTSATIDEFIKKIQAYIEDNKEEMDVFRGNINRNKEMSSLLKTDNDIQTAIENWISKGKYAKLLNMWVKGLEVNWSKLYE